MAILATEGLDDFLELYANTGVGMIMHQGSMVKHRLMSSQWIVAIADGNAPDGLLALGDFLGYGSISDEDIEMFSFPAGPAHIIVATLRGDAFEFEKAQEFFPVQPKIDGQGWEEQKPTLVLADYDRSPFLFDGFLRWLDACKKEIN